jgi:hypothetical protein
MAASPPYCEPFAHLTISMMNATRIAGDDDQHGLIVFRDHSVRPHR